MSLDMYVRNVNIQKYVHFTTQMLWTILDGQNYLTIPADKILEVLYLFWLHSANVLIKKFSTVMPEFEFRWVHKAATKALLRTIWTS